MGTILNHHSYSNSLFGKTRWLVLYLLYGNTEKYFYTRQIIDAVKTGRGTVQRELKNLTDTGIIIREVQGRQVYYRANENCPIYNELKGIIEKALEIDEDISSDIIAQRFRVPEDRLIEYCHRNKIQKLSLFGSVLRKDYRADSDIDILVEFEHGKVPGLFGLAEMEAELSELTGGRKVDMRTSEELSRHFRENVVREARVQYAAAR